jgi:NADPH-dependent 2,4-dienoyl-CoA reductase/sulfur reductase-like enzyme
MKTYAFRYVILGGGVVAGYAVREFAAAGVSPGELCMVSADTLLPYERPTLSKGFLRGDHRPQDILINPSSFYHQHGIATFLNTCVVAIDFARRRLITNRDMSIEFEQLLIATGARLEPALLPGGELPGVHTLNNRHDAEQLREAAQEARHVVVLGGSFLSIEIAASLSSLGVTVTSVFPQKRLLNDHLTPELAQFIHDYCEAQGLQLMPQRRAQAIEGNGRVRSVAFEDGHRLPADVVVVASGILPAVEPFLGTELELDEESGIVVNRYLETNIPGVFAAGDVVSYYDVFFRKWRRVSHWRNAVEQARHAAQMMTGRRRPFVSVPHLYAHIFDLSFEFWGDTSGADRAVYLGSFEETAFNVWWLRDSHLVATFSSERGTEHGDAQPGLFSRQRSLPLELMRQHG